MAGTYAAIIAITATQVIIHEGTEAYIRHIRKSQPEAHNNEKITETTPVFALLTTPYNMMLDVKFDTVDCTRYVYFHCSFMKDINKVLGTFL